MRRESALLDFLDRVRQPLLELLRTREQPPAALALGFLVRVLVPHAPTCRRSEGLLINNAPLGNGEQFLGSGPADRVLFVFLCKFKSNKDSFHLKTSTFFSPADMTRRYPWIWTANIHFGCHTELITKTKCL